MDRSATFYSSSQLLKGRLEDQSLLLSPANTNIIGKQLGMSPEGFDERAGEGSLPHVYENASSTW